MLLEIPENWFFLPAETITWQPYTVLHMHMQLQWLRNYQQLLYTPATEHHRLFSLSRTGKCYTCIYTMLRRRKDEEKNRSVRGKESTSRSQNEWTKSQNEHSHGPYHVCQVIKFPISASAGPLPTQHNLIFLMEHRETRQGKSTIAEGRRIQWNLSVMYSQETNKRALYYLY